MKRVVIFASLMMLASCHPIPAVASETGVESLMVDDALKVCGIAGVNDNDVCSDVLSEEYVDALMRGGLEFKKHGQVWTAKQAIPYAAMQIGCLPDKSQLCKEHVVNWASWYLYGQRHYPTNKIIQKEVANYFKGDKDA